MKRAVRQVDKLAKFITSFVISRLERRDDLEESFQSWEGFPSCGGGIFYFPLATFFLFSACFFFFPLFFHSKFLNILLVSFSSKNRENKCNCNPKHHRSYHYTTCRTTE